METTTKIVKFIALYVRVSTGGQEDQKTVDNQIMVLEERAKENNYQIVQTYKDEGWSGDTLIRPELDRLRMDAKDKKWDAVLIYDPDRLARRYSYQELIVDELREKDIQVMFYTIAAPANEEDRLMYGVRGLFSQYERFKISERFRLGKLRTARDGHIMGSGAPYGYRYILKNKEKDIKHGYYEIVEEEARVVRMIFKWVADDGLTIRNVIRKLKDLGIKPRKSKRGYWATSTLTHLLRNRVYIGVAQWGKTYAVVPKKPFKDEKYKKIKKSSRKNKPVEEWINIDTPAIIDEDLFNRTRKRVEDNFALSDRNKKNSYLLSGKIWCTCGKRRCGCSPLGGKHLYYRCNGRVHSFPLPSPCSEKGLNARVADKLVWQKLSGLMSSPDLMRKQVSRWLDKTKNNTEVSFADISLIKKEIDSLKTKEDRYNKAYADGIFTIEKLKEYVTPLREKVASLEVEISKAKQQQEEIKVSSPGPSEIEEFSQKAIEELKNLKFEQKRAIILDILDKVVATQDKLLVYGYIAINPNVTFCSSNRHCWVTKCGEVHAF